MEKMKKVKLVNLTPHPLTLLDEDNNIILKLESQGAIRLSSTIERVGEVNNIPLTQTVFGKCELPPKIENVFYIVSLPVAQYAKQLGREDFLIPGEVVREGSQILGMKSLAVL